MLNPFISFISLNFVQPKNIFDISVTLEVLKLVKSKYSNVTDMRWMFTKCYKLKEIKGINKFITNKVTDMNTMFQKCYELEYLDLTNFDTSNVTDM